VNTQLLPVHHRDREPAVSRSVPRKDPVTFASTAPAISTSVGRFQKNPQAENYSVGVTQKINAELSIHIDGVYVHSRGDRIQIRPQPPESRDRIRPLPQYGSSIRSVNSRVELQATFIRLDKRLSHRYTFLVSYTLAKAETSGAARQQRRLLPCDGSEQPIPRRGPVDTDRRHSVVASGTAILPGT